MIEYLRAAVQDSRQCHQRNPGPARAQVLAWSAQRVVDLLRHKGRRPLSLNCVGAAELTGQERTLAALFAALGSGDRDGALAHAQWLVPTAEAKRLVRWAEPVVECAAFARRAA